MYAKTTSSLITMNGNELIPYIVTAGQNLGAFNTSPFGLELLVVDAEKQSSQEFIGLLNALDGLGFGNKNMAMDKWVALDCGMLPGAFVGLAMSGADLCEEDKVAFGVDMNYTGLVPICEYCAIPTANPGTWIGHTLTSYFKKNGYATMAKSLGLAVIPASKIMGVAQYDNPSLKAHSKFGALHLITAVTSAHGMPDMTFVYSMPKPNSKVLEALFLDPHSGGLLMSEEMSEPSFLLDPSDLKKKSAMQFDLEHGICAYSILPPGWVEAGSGIAVQILKH